MKLTGADIICECLLEQGVDTVFGYPGGAALNTYDALYKYSDKIRHILTAHEQGASHAADGYARSTGKTGVVITTSGPGATNIVTGLATANIDSIPLVAITANVNLDQLGRDSFQEVDIVNISKPITKASTLVTRVEARRSSLPAAAERVLFWWTSPRTSPPWSPSLSRSIPKRPSPTPLPIPIPSRVCRRLSASRAVR